MNWHGSREDTRRTVEKIIANRAKGILVITGIGSGPCPLAGLQPTLDAITLNKMSFSPQEQLFIDAKGLSMPSLGQAWGTKAFLVDGGQAQPTGDEAFVCRVEAVPMRVIFDPKGGTDQPMDGIDVLSYAEIDNVVNYMRMGMHDRVAATRERAAVTSPHWWDDKRLVTGKCEKDEFMVRVMEYLADQYDGSVGSDPPTWGFPSVGTDLDRNLSKAGNVRGVLVRSEPQDDEDGVSDKVKSRSDPEEAYTAVQSAVSIPKQAAEKVQENQKVAEPGGKPFHCLSAALQRRSQQEPTRSQGVGDGKNQAEAEPQDLPPQGVSTPGLSGRGDEETIGRVRREGLDQTL